MRAVSIVWLLGGVTLAVFGQVFAVVVLRRCDWPVAMLGFVRRTVVVFGVALVLIGFLFLAGLGVLGIATNGLMLVWVLARLGRVRR